MPFTPPSPDTMEDEPKGFRPPPPETEESLPPATQARIAKIKAEREQFAAAAELDAKKAQFWNNAAVVTGNLNPLIGVPNAVRAIQRGTGLLPPETPDIPPEGIPLVHFQREGTEPVQGSVNVPVSFPEANKLGQTMQGIIGTGMNFTEGAVSPHILPSLATGGPLVQAGIVASMAPQLPDIGKGTGEAAAGIEADIAAGRDADIRQFVENLTGEAATGAFVAGPVARGLAPSKAAQIQAKALGLEKSAAELEAIDRRARNIMAPGTMRPQEQAAFVPPQAEAPAGMVQGTLERPNLVQRMVGRGPDFIEPPDVTAPARTKVESETRGKVSFGAKAPTLLRNAIPGAFREEVPQPKPVEQEVQNAPIRLGIAKTPALDETPGRSAEVVEGVPAPEKPAVPQGEGEVGAAAKAAEPVPKLTEEVPGPYRLKVSPESVDAKVEHPNGTITIRSPVVENPDGTFTVRSVTAFVQPGIMDPRPAPRDSFDLSKPVTAGTKQEARALAFRGFVDALNRGEFDQPQKAAGIKALPEAKLSPEEKADARAALSETQPEGEPAPAKAKGASEMTQAEFLSNPVVKRGLKRFPDKSGAEIHKTYVRKALESGKPVPAEVLADYPDLAQKYGKAATPTQEAQAETPAATAPLVAKVVGKVDEFLAKAKADAELVMTHDEKRTIAENPNQFPFGAFLVELPISDIRQDNPVDVGTVKMYSAMGAKDVKAPPVEVSVTSDYSATRTPEFYLTDGNHRFTAAQMAGRQTIMAKVVPWDKASFEFFKKYISEKLKPDMATPSAPPPAVEKAAEKVKQQVQAVAKTEGQRPAKEVKAELIDRLEKAIADAPSEASIDPSLQEYRSEIESSRRGAVIGYNKAERSELALRRSNSIRITAGTIEWSLRRSGIKQIEIDIPGDGKFKVWNTKEALGEMLNRVKRLQTNAGKGVAEEGRKPPSTLPLSEKGMGGIKPKQNPRAGEAGFISLDPVREIIDAVYYGGLPKLPKPALKLLDALEQTKAGIKWRLYNGENLSTIARDKNRADVLSAKAATVATNGLENDLNAALSGTPKANKRSLITPWKDRQEMEKTALSLVRESGEDLAELRRQRDLVANAPEPQGRRGVRGQLWKNARELFLKASEFAEQNFQALKGVSERYRDVMDRQQDSENAYGIESPRRNNYVHHVQDIVGEESLGLFSDRGGPENVQFRKERTYNTFADSLAKGVIPESMNAIELARKRLYSGQRALNNRLWVDAARAIVDPSTGKPIIGKMIRRQHPATGDVTMEPEPGYRVVEFGGQRVAISDGFAPYFRAFTEPSWLQKSLPGRVALNLAGTGKHIMLGFDIYHMMRLGLWASIFQNKPTGYKKGLALADYGLPEIANMVKRGDLPQKYLNYARENVYYKQMLDDAGLNIYSIEDNLHRAITENVPVMGNFNRWLFQGYQRGLMQEAAIYEMRRQMDNHPELSGQEIARMVAKDINTRFGQLGAESWIKSRTMKDIARALFLAPGWNEGLIRSEIGAAKQTITSARDTLTQRRLVVGGLAAATAKMVVAFFIGNQILNLMFQGKPTWENDEPEDMLNAVIPDPTGSSDGIRINPYSLALEVSHHVADLYSRQRTGDVGGAAGLFNAAKGTITDYGRGRLSALAKPTIQFFTDRDVFGTLVKPKDALEKFAKSAAPVPISGGAALNLGTELAGRAISTAQGAEYEGTKQEHQAQYLKQMLATMGIRSQTMPSPINRIQQLAAKFNADKKVEVDPRLYEGDYSQLTRYLQIGNYGEARKEIEKLMSQKDSDTMLRHYQRWPTNPFTHNSGREAEFIAGLTPEQQRTYEAAIMRRQGISERFYKLFDKVLAEKK